MQSSIETVPSSKARLWTGRIMSALPVLFLLLDGVMKLFKPAPVLEATARLGYPENTIIGIGILLLVCTLIYVIPRTSILGAILLTGYLGGAVASHVRISEGWFPVLFPVFIGVLIWGGIFLRDNRVQALIPLKS